MRAEKNNGAEDTSAAPALHTPEDGNSSPTLRRTRGSSPVRQGSAPADHGADPNTRNHAAKKANGHANGSANPAAEADGATCAGSRINGHDQASSSVPAAATPPLLPEAGSDDASGASVAIAAVSAAAGADRHACAELAKGTNGKKRHSSKTRVSGFVLTNPDLKEDQPRVPSEKKEYPPGEGPLPLDPAEFVEEIHQRVDLFEVWVGLLNSGDDKIRQRAVEKLTEMRYKSAASPEEEPQEIIFDLVRPKRED
jgi:hypothetical protein